MDINDEIDFLNLQYEIRDLKKELKELKDFYSKKHNCENNLQHLSATTGLCLICNNSVNLLEEL